MGWAPSEVLHADPQVILLALEGRADLEDDLQRWMLQAQGHKLAPKVRGAPAQRIDGQSLLAWAKSHNAAWYRKHPGDRPKRPSTAQRRLASASGSSPP